MSTPDAFGPSRTLIFDTGPLWEYILYSAVTKRTFTSLRRELRDLTNEPRYEKLKFFISWFQIRTTTAHVVAELSRRILETKQRDRERKAIWETVFREFVGLGMDEELVKLSAMRLELVGRLGAVDVSLLQLGRNLAKTRPRILTIDGRFATECFSAGLQAVLLSNLVSAEDPMAYV